MGSRDHFREGLPVEVTAERRLEFQHKSLEEAMRCTEYEVGPEPPSQP